ncbi:MAG TPA: hypothetical protein PKD35_10805, partial [Nitrosomonas sp.]|nr:hypothetical protein [Nitrosomonas sp.]
MEKQVHYTLSLLISFAFIVFPLSNTKASNTEIQTDHLLGSVSALHIDAPGANQFYTLSEANGRLVNTNLFYSFSEFNIGSGDTVWFNLNTPDLAQVISRVTAGNPSYFDGQLK